MIVTDARGAIAAILGADVSVPRDPIVAILEIAIDLHKQKIIDDATLIETMKKCVNATAECNGYVEKFGLPFPEVPLDKL